LKRRDGRGVELADFLWREACCLDAPRSRSSFVLARIDLARVGADFNGRKHYGLALDLDDAHGKLSPFYEFLNQYRGVAARKPLSYDSLQLEGAPGDRHSAAPVLKKTLQDDGVPQARRSLAIGQDP